MSEPSQPAEQIKPAKPTRSTKSATLRELLDSRAWRKWTLAGAATRVPVAMAPLAFVFIGQASTGSYGVGASMAAAFALAEAVGAPLAGRILGRVRDLRIGLCASLAAAAVFALGLAAASHAGSPPWVLIGFGIAVGALPAGVQGGMRALLPRMLPKRLHQRAFAVDASLLEVQWMLAPALVTATVLIEPAAAAAVMALFAGLGLAMITTLPIATVTEARAATAPTEQVRPSTRKRSQRTPHRHTARARIQRGSGAWRVPAARSAYLASAVLGYAEGTVTVCVPALLVSNGGRGETAGLVLLVMAAASGAGGLIYGWLVSQSPKGGPTPPTALTRVSLALKHSQGSILLAALGLSCLPLAMTGSVFTVVVLVAAFGLFVAPINAARSAQLSQALPDAQHPEGFSILYALNGMGFGLAGLLVAAIGDPRPAMEMVGAATTLIGVITALSALGRTAAQRKRRAPETTQSIPVSQHDHDPQSCSRMSPSPRAPSPLSHSTSNRRTQ